MRKKTSNKIWFLSKNIKRSDDKNLKMKLKLEKEINELDYSYEKCNESGAMQFKIVNDIILLRE